MTTMTEITPTEQTDRLDRQHAPELLGDGGDDLGLRCLLDFLGFLGYLSLRELARIGD